MNAPDFAAAAAAVIDSRHTTVFTGAGISVESGIPPFRGPDGLWSRYDPALLDISGFRARPEESWPLIKEIFYDNFGQAQPNRAHLLIAQLEAAGQVQAVITQNIDNLHYEAGSRRIFEFHGTSRLLLCENCGRELEAFTPGGDGLSELFDLMPPRCPECEAILRPAFTFFGEPVPEPAASLSFQEAELADLFLLIGTTGSVVPAAQIPVLAKAAGARIIEINPEPSEFTGQISDIYLPGPATTMMEGLVEAM